MTEMLVLILLSIATVFIFVASIGLLRLPDLYMRMHAATKATSFGVVIFLVAIFIFDPTLATFIKALMIILFIFVTAPVASHLISRIAHHHKVPQSRKMVRDDLDEKKNPL